MRGEAESAFLEFRTHGRPRDMARVFDLTAQELLLVAGNLARSGEEAEELLQQTFLAGMQQRARWDAERPLLPWLLGILLRLQRAERRRRASSRERGGDAGLAALVSTADTDPEQHAEEAELASALAAAIASLPETSRDVLTLRLVHGLEPVQIAHALGRPLETVKTQLRRGKERLRETLPRSLAALVVVGSDGMVAVRESVLRAAREQGAGPALALAGGSVVAKAMIALSVLTFVGLWWLSRAAPAAVDLEQPPGAAHATVEVAGLGPRSALEDAARVTGRRESQAPSATGSSVLAIARTALACRVVWDSDGQPPPGVPVALRDGARGRPSLALLACSDATGVARFEGLVPGRVWLGAERGGELTLDLASGENEVELRVPAGVLV